MMTTSYPHNGGMHPQGMPHAHPGMGGPGPNPGQPGMPPGMQHVSGPNGPVRLPSKRLCIASSSKQQCLLINKVTWAWVTKIPWQT
ncbi:hypothetical protein GGP41_004684 [Bipolaris sorokiniana]|uniref:Uncharacterized protein n=1 Tax=Cochliobolus sativus TaxID=45130 RepID=A0A8H6DSB0_COCSA|nr:hypothetical protein GGP41_004684 [Bipolaris sorokiniana]